MEDWREKFLNTYKVSWSTARLELHCHVAHFSSPHYKDGSTCLHRFGFPVSLCNMHVHILCGITGGKWIYTLIHNLYQNMYIDSSHHMPLGHWSWKIKFILCPLKLNFCHYRYFPSHVVCEWFVYWPFVCLQTGLMFWPFMQVRIVISTKAHT